MTKEDTIENALQESKDFVILSYPEEDINRIVKVIKQHYLGKLPKDRVSQGIDTGVIHYNQALADVRKVIG